MLSLLLQRPPVILYSLVYPEMTLVYFLCRTSSYFLVFYTLLAEAVLTNLNFFCYPVRDLFQLFLLLHHSLFVVLSRLNALTKTAEFISISA